MCSFFVTTLKQSAQSPNNSLGNDLVYFSIPTFITTRSISNIVDSKIKPILRWDPKGPRRNEQLPGESIILSLIPRNILILALKFNRRIWLLLEPKISW